MRTIRRSFAAVFVPTLLVVVGLFAADGANAQKRVALVVGINTYPNLAADKQLANAVSDARAMRDALAGLGFDVIYGENFDRRTLVERLFDLTARLGKEDTAFFFFAGHGVSFSGANYLLPSDIPTPRATGRAEEGRLADQAIAETQVIERISSSGARVTVVVLDACRNNPLQGSDRRSVGNSRGLAQTQPARGVFSIYSAGFGQEALDRLSGDDRHPNSVFTRVFIDQLKTPGLDLKAVATRTRRIVVDLTEKVGHEQFPAYYDQVIGGDVYLAGAPRTADQKTEQPPRTEPNPAAQAWNATKDTTSQAVLQAFIRQFDGTVYANLARARLEELKKSQSAAVDPLPERQVDRKPEDDSRALDAKPSFDCAQARQPAELAICRSPVLSGLDVRMSAIYQRLRNASDANRRRTLLENQRLWLSQRNACGQDAVCLERKYREQIRFLEQAG